MLILSDIISFCAATRRNLVADDCAAVALERIEPDGSPTRPFPQVSTGSYLTVNRAPALPTSSFRTQPIRPPPRAGSPPALAAYHRYLFSLGGHHPATVKARALAITERRQLRQPQAGPPSSARNGIPVKQAQGLHSSSEHDDEPPQLVSGCFEGGDTMAAMCIERI